MGFEPRPCPMCGSQASESLLSVSGRDLFRANWSYRPEALSEIGDLADEQFPICQCTGCAFIFAHRLPTPAFLDFVYERAIDAEKARVQNMALASLAQKMNPIPLLLTLAPSQRPLRMLDYGCGFGPTLEVLRCLPSITAIGYETSSARLDELTKRGLRATGARDTLAGEGPFGAVIVDNVLEHLPDPLATLVFIRSLCETGAAAFVSVPEFSAEKLRRIGQRRGELQMDVNPWEHLSYFDPAHLDALLRRSGFEPLQRCELPVGVDIGLRPLADRRGRIKNALASGVRLARYAASGDALPQTTARYYRAV